MNEIDIYRDALNAIAFASGDQPEAMNVPEADWYRRRFYDCVTTAARALNLGANLGADVPHPTIVEKNRP